MRKTCLNEIYELAKRDRRVLFFGSDISAGTLEQFKKEMPERYFMEGVLEANIVGMMSGLAMNGKIPYFNTIAVFLTRRCLEQIMMDVAMHNLKVRLIGSGGGLVYAPLGATHIASDDFAILRPVPNMTIVSPCDADEMKRLMPQTVDWDGPMYIRLGKGGDKIVSSNDEDFKIGRAIKMCSGDDVLMVTTGTMLQPVIEASNLLKENGISCAVLHMHTVKPLDQETLFDEIKNVKAVVTVEEHSIIGGLGSAVTETLVGNFGLGAKKFMRLGLPDCYSNVYGSQEEQREHYNISTPHIVSRVLDLLTSR